jgi:hypothetical protein
MRGARRRQIFLLALVVLLAVGFWASVSRLNVPQGTMRLFEVHGSADFYNLLLDTSMANCSGGQPFKVQ